MLLLVTRTYYTDTLTAERERLWKEQVEQRRLMEAENRHARRHDSDEDDHDNDDTPHTAPAAIDSKPAEPGIDPQTLINPGSHVPANVTVPDIKLEEVDTANYSTNV